ncbi:MAG: aminopeptidase P family protein [Gammaproteobacteria bacterium]|nr:aminopeptidase P family protein [Gammaproteobacteria bacterium]MDH5215054.1 aminopeptidase P family protein [Gammaproteobacteria bacterium]
MGRHILAFLVVTLLATTALPGKLQADPVVPDVLSLREQSDLRDDWLVKRLDTLLPALMERAGVDMWIVIAREYAEDPVVETLLPATWMSARRRTVLMFHQPEPGAEVERLSATFHAVASRDPQTAARHGGDIYPREWFPHDGQPDQWARIGEIVAERDPQRIAVNRSEFFPLADGLTATEERGLVDALGERYADRLVSAEKLALGWLETRIPEEMVAYRTIQRIAHAIVIEGLSEKVITPGRTRTSDVQWWYRERIRELGLETWFHPSVSATRRAEQDGDMSAMFAEAQSDPLIMPGDLLHTDFGIRYLGFTTDTQNHAYVLRPGETDAPEGLKSGLAAANRAQDILMENFRAGETANDLLARAVAQARDEELDAVFYSHALGYHGHGAGPWIGAWDKQQGVPGMGDYPIHPNTAWSIELNVQKAVPEWDDQPVRFRLEEDAYFDGETIEFIDGRQTSLHLIPRPR